MIAKLCTWGRTRESAISNMIRALREYKILGIKTTIPFHLRVLHNATFLKGNYDTTFIDTKFDKEDLKRRQNSDPTVAVIAAAFEALRGGERGGRPCDDRSAGRGVPVETLREVTNVGQ